MWENGRHDRLWWHLPPGGFILTRMKQTIWETPSFTELRMDAEIGSYQDDFDPTRDVPAFVQPRESDPAPRS